MVHIVHECLLNLSQRPTTGQLGK